MIENLREKIVFGPIKSRRLGVSLGINILPTEMKICNFNCIYCECGWNSNDENICSENKKFPNKNEIKTQLENKLSELCKNNEQIDTITFSGNGEPTLHPDFLEIINNTVEIRNKFFRALNGATVKITVLSNATNLLNKNIFEGLKKIENPILKLDSANPETILKINLQSNGIPHQVRYDGKTGIRYGCKTVQDDSQTVIADLLRNPLTTKVSLEKIVDGMKQFNGNFILQIMFLRGEIDGQIVDNTTAEEVSGLIEIMKITKPRQVMIYGIDRKTPAKNLIKLSSEEMQKIAAKIEAAGFNVLYV